MAEHPIIPPPELVERLRSEAPHGIRDAGVTRELHLIAAAYRAGADAEFEGWRRAVSGYVKPSIMDWATSLEPCSLAGSALPAPKPPSLAEEALLAIDTAVADGRISAEIARVTRAALERLQELENNG